MDDSNFTITTYETSSYIQINKIDTMQNGSSTRLLSSAKS